MNETTPQPDHDEPLAPLDAFEQQWVDQLAKREPDLAQSEEAFVQRVVQQAEAASAAGQPIAVIARIGQTALPYAIAAALVFAAFVGWTVLNESSNNTNDQPAIAGQLDSETQPDNDVPVVTPDRPKVALGSLIASVKSAATEPATSLTTTFSESPDTPIIGNLFELLGDSVPDLKEILTPLAPKDEQSRV